MRKENDSCTESLPSSRSRPSLWYWSSAEAEGSGIALARAQQATPEDLGPSDDERRRERGDGPALVRRGDQRLRILAVLDEIAGGRHRPPRWHLPRRPGTGSRSRAFSARYTPGSPMCGTRSSRLLPKTTSSLSAGRPRSAHEGTFQGFAPSGKPVTWTGINIFRFECGKIAESWSEVDGLGRLNQLGLIATPTP